MNVNKKKILVLTSRYPYPVIGGDRLRIYNQCRELSKYFDLTLLSLCETNDELNAVLPNDGVFKRVERILLPKFKSYLNSLIVLFFSKTPLQVAYYKSHNFKIKVDEEAAKHDLVLCHLIRTSEYLSDFNGVKVVEMTDAISLNYKRVKELKDLKGIKSWIYRFEQKRLISYECKVIESFDLCSVISPIDHDYLKDHCEKSVSNIIVSGNGVDLSNFPFQYHAYQQNRVLRIVFIGNMSSFQNFDAAYWFAKKVLPLIASDYPVVFEVVGRIPQDSHAILSKLDNVKVLGGVDNVAAAVNGAHIGVCPMRIGAGVQNKVLEYMALGLPCITTSLGLEGIKAEPKNHLLVADTPKQFYKKVTDIVKNVQSTHVMVLSARKLIVLRYSWESQQASFVNAVSGLVEQTS